MRATRSRAPGIWRRRSVRHSPFLVPGHVLWRQMTKGRILSSTPFSRAHRRRLCRRLPAAAGADGDGVSELDFRRTEHLGATTAVMNMLMPTTASQVIALGLAVIACGWDLRTRRIPQVLTLGGALAAFVFHLRPADGRAALSVLGLGGRHRDLLRAVRARRPRRRRRQAAWRARRLARAGRT